MGDNILWLLLFAAFLVAFIEFLPKRFDAVPKLAVAVIIVGAGIRWLPNWYGWVVLLVGLADLFWTYHAFARDSEWPGPIILLTRAGRVTLAGIRGFSRIVIDLFARRKERAAQKEKIPLSRAEMGARIRKWSSALALIIVSPVAAIPAAFVLTLASLVIYAVFGDADGIGGGPVGFIKSWLAGTFMIVVVVLDLIYRRFWLALPALIVVGYGGAAFVLKSGSYWRRFARAALAIGTLYPVVYMLAFAFDWFDEPFFN